MNYFNKSFKKAKKFYKIIQKEKIDDRKAKKFLKSINLLFRDYVCDIVLKKDGVKVIINYNTNIVFIDYDYGHEDSIFITYNDKTSLRVKEIDLEQLKKEVKSSCSSVG